jgi:Ca2+-binding EF-hand superfamily protein
MSSIAGWSGQFASMGMMRPPMSGTMGQTGSSGSQATPPDFSTLDADSSGGISLDELTSALSSGGTSSDSRIESLFTAMDSDSDGSISESEKDDFDSALNDRMSAMQVLAQLAGQDETDTASTASMPPPPPPGAMAPAGGASAEDDAASILESADSDSDGALSLDEFTTAVNSAAGEGTFSTDDISAIYDLLDSDGSASVSSDELTAFLQAMQPQRPSGPPPADWMQQATDAYASSTESTSTTSLAA